MGQHADLPPPLLPDEVDLRDFAYMPLKVEQLRNSKLAKIAVRNPRVAASGLFLWAFSWHQVPAGSIENDEDTLRDAACCPPSAWGQGGVRDQILRGWVLCSDNRWWHPVVSGVAWEAWLSKVEQRYYKGQKKLQKRVERAGSDVHGKISLTKDQWIQAVYPKTYAALQGMSAATLQLGLDMSLATLPFVAGDIALREGKVRETLLGETNVAATSSVDGGLPPPIADVLEDRRTRPKKPREKATPGSLPIPDHYASFIEVYKPPRTYSPLKASIAFKKAVDKGTSAETLIACAKLYAAERGDQVQNPERFLEETWRNYLPEAVRLSADEIAVRKQVEAAKKTWGPYADAIILAIGEGKFRAWFRQARLIANGGSFYIVTTSLLVRDRLESEFRPALEKVLPAPFEIKFEPATEDKPND